MTQPSGIFSICGRGLIQQTGLLYSVPEEQLVSVESSTFHLNPLFSPCERVMSLAFFLIALLKHETFQESNYKLESPQRYIHGK